MDMVFLGSVRSKVKVTRDELDLQNGFISITKEQSGI